MSHSKIRRDKRCLNCGRYVAERFCPECGQENEEIRRSFYHLVFHFWTDFIHYDSLFWKTIKYLLLPTAKLTKDYLAGKRKSQVNPVSLYIFISFIVFFIPAILPDFKEHAEKKEIEKTPAKEEDQEDGNNARDRFVHFDIDKLDLSSIGTVERLDSIQQARPKGEKIPFEKYLLAKKLLTYNQMENPKEKIIESMVHNFPKAIFLYMPIFAFWLWLFHSKKKWLYFDHGIYTLHYFSFNLLAILVYILVDWLFSIFHIKIPFLITVAMFAYFIYYFFHTHRRMYRESKAVSRLICTALFFINTVCIFIFLLFYLVAVAAFSVH